MLKRTQALLSRWLSRNSQAAARRQRVQRRRKSFLEPLEGRNLLATFHVALTGSDTIGDGVTVPFRTIQAAITAASNTVDGNDIVKVAAGVYNTAGVDQRFIIGSPSSPPAGLSNLQLLGGWDATFTTRNPAATPTDYTFTNSVDSATRYDIPVYHPNTTIDGFTFRSSDGTTKRESDTLQVEATNVTFSNNIVHVGIRNGGSRPTGVVTSTLNNSIAGLQILNNQFHANFTGTLNTNSYAQGIFLNPTASSGVTISGNSFQGNNFAAMLTVSSVSGVTIDSNTFTRTGPSGFQAISVREPVNPPGAISNISITDNIIDGAGISSGIQIGAENSPTGSRSILPLTGITLSSNSITNTTAAVVIGPGFNQLNSISASISDNTFNANGVNLFYSALGAGGSTTVNGASINPGSNTVTASTTADQDFRLVRSGGNLEVYDVTVPASPALILSQAIGTAAITITGAASFDNSLTIDFTGGNPIPSGGLVFNGGTGGNDTLAVTGTGVSSATLTHANANDGSIVINGSALTYTGLDPILINTPGANWVLEYATAAAPVVLAASGSDLLVTRSGVAEEVTISPAGLASLVVRTGSGADTVELDSLPAGWSAGITLDGQGGADILNVDTAAITSTGSLTLQGIETANLNYNITASSLSGDATTVNVNDAPSGQIQDGVNIVAPGGTVNAAAGTYNENVVINKRLTLDGAGDGTTASDTIIDGSVGGTPSSVITITASGAGASDRLVVRDLRVQGASTNGLRLAGNTSFITLQNVSSDGGESSTAGHKKGILLDDNTVINDLVLDGLELANFFNAGIYTGSAVTPVVNGLSLVNSTFSGGRFGIHVSATSSITNNEDGFTNIHIADNSFTGHAWKGMYIEKLDNAVIERNTFVNVGLGLPVGGNNGNGNVGLDLNLKYGNHSNIQVLNNVFDNTGLYTGSGANVSGGLAIHPRNDAPSYNSNPAAADNILVSGNIFQNAPAGGRSILIGETGKNTITPTNLVISNNSLSDGTFLGVVNTTAGTINAEANWWGSNLAASVAARSSGAVDSDPWLALGTDTSPAIGFQPIPLLSSTADGTIIPGTGGDDAITVTVSGANVVVTVNVVNIYTLPSATLDKLTINGGLGSDTLTVIGPIGKPVVFNGEGGASDALRITATGENAVYTPSATTFGDGSIAFGGSTVTFTGLEPIDFDFVGGTFTLVLPGANDVVDIADSTLLDNVTPALRVSGSSGGVNFENARVRGAAIVIDTTAVGGTDDIEIVNANSAHNNTSLTITAGAEAGDVISVNGTATFSGVTTLEARTINLNANITNGAGGATATVVNVTAPGQVQDGVNFVAPGGTVNVAAGTYVESLSISKALTLLGPNAGINPNTGIRGAEAIVLPPVSNPDPFSPTSSPIIYVETSNVTIDGITVDGDNPALSGGVTQNGANVDAIEAISSYEGVGNIHVHNNIVRNLSYTGVDFYNFVSDNATTNSTIQHNKFDNIGYLPYGFGIGVLIYNNFYAAVTDNVMTNVRLGVQTGNYSKANPNGLFTPTISNNNISAAKTGIYHNLAYSNASAFTISDNQIAMVDEPGSTRANGIFVSSLQGTVGVNLSDNTITSVATAYPTAGYRFWNTPTTSPLVIDGGSISGTKNGVWVDNHDGGNGNGGATAVTVDGVTINSSDAGVYVLDNLLNTNGATSSVTVQCNTTIIGAAAGVLVQGTDASATVQDNLASIHGNVIGIDVNGGSATITNNSIYDNATAIRFTGGGSGSVTSNDFDDVVDNGTDLQLTGTAGAVTIGANNQFAGDTFYIDNASTQSFNLVGNGTSFDVANNFRIEDRMHHRVDTDLAVTVGLVTWVTGNLYVTDAGTDHSVQRGVDAASSGNTINVEAGSYVGTIAISGKNNLTLLGAGNNIVTGSVLSGPNTSPTNTATLSLANTTGTMIDGFVITRNGNSTTDWASNGMTYGVLFTTGATGNTLQNSLVTGNRSGIDLRNTASGNTIKNNLIDFNRTGILVNDLVSNNVFQENFITNNWTAGILFLDTTTPATGNTFTGNNISGNWYSQVEDRRATGAARDLSGNWFGTTTITTTASLAGEPGYAAQVPVAYGGTAVPSPTPLLISGPGHANVDFSPYLATSTDLGANPSNGFQGDFATLYVSAAGAQVQSGGRINEGVSRLTSPGMLRVLTGTYTENALTAGKAVTIAPGASPGQVTINGDLTLDANDTLAIEVNGTDPATEYDNLIVNGVVTLGGAALSVSGTYMPFAADSFTLIANDLADAVSGTFNGLPSGTLVNVNGTMKRIFYTGNDGNDVILTSATPTTSFVSNSLWGALSAGDFILDADAGTTGNQSAIFGYNAFTTVAAAQAATTASGTIIVNAGTYAVAVVGSGTQTIEITGPNAAQAVTFNSLATVAGQNVIIEGTSTLTIGDATSTTIASVISGSGSLVKQGAGTVALNGANIYSGATTINVGTLQLGNATALGTTAGSTSVTSGAVLDLNGQAVGAEGLTLNGTGLGANGALINSSASAASLVGAVAATTYSVGGSGNITLSGTVQGTLTKVGANTLTLSGMTDNAGLVVTANAGTTVLAKTSSGTVHAIGTGGVGLTISSGATVQLAGSGGDQIFTQADVTVNAGGIFDLNGRSEGFDILSGGGNIRNAGALATLTIGENSGGGTYTGTIGFTGANNIAVTKVGSAPQYFDGSNTYDGLTTVSGGFLVARNNNALGSTAAGTTVASGATLQLENVSGNVSIPTGEALTITGNGMPTNRGALAGWTGNNTYAGPITLAGNSVVHVTTGAALTISGAISESGGSRNLTKNGGGSLTFSGTGSNTYTGTTILDLGILTLSKTGGAFAISGPMQMGAGNGNQPYLRMGASNQFATGVVMTAANSTGNWTRFDLLGTSQTLAGAQDTLGGLVIQNGGSGVGSATPATLTIDNTANYVLRSHIRNQDSVASGPLNIIKNGTGTLSFERLPGGASARTTYTGTTTVNAGTLVLNGLSEAAANAFNSQVTVHSGAFLETTGTSNVQHGTSSRVILNGGTYNHTSSGFVTWNGLTLTADSPLNVTNTGASNQVFFDGSVIGTNRVLTITNTGAATTGVHFRNNTGSNYSGSVVVNGGEIAIGTSAGSVYANADLTLTGSTLQLGAAAFAMTGTGASLRSLNGNGTVTAAGTNPVTLTLGTNNGSGTFSGTLIDGAAGQLVLSKTGTGTQILSGNNTNTGATSIATSGTLQVGNAGTTGALGTGVVTVTGTLDYNRTDSYNVANTISGTGTLRQIGTGTLNITGAASVPSNLINSGRINVIGSMAGAVTANVGGTLGGTGTITGVVSGAGTFTPGTATPGTLTITGNFNSSGTVNFEVNSAWTTPGTDYDRFVVNGGVNLTGSTITFTNATDTTAPAALSMLTLIDNDGTIGDLTTAATSPLNGDTVTIGSRSFRLFYNGGDGNNVVLVEASTPTVVYVEDIDWDLLTTGTNIADADFGTNLAQPAIYGVNAFNNITDALNAVTAGGTVIVNGGTYAEAVVSSGTKTIEITGPDTAQAVVINSLATAAGQNIVLEGSSTLTIGDATSTTIASVISGSGSLVKQGSGTVTLSAANTLTGGVTLNAGTLAFGSNTAAGTGTLTINGGQVQSSGAARTLVNPVVVGGDFEISGTLALALNGAMNLGGATRQVTVSTTGDAAFGGVISNGGLTKAGAERLTLNGGGANVYTGLTTVTAGELVLNKTSGVNAVGGNVEVSGGSLIWSSVSDNQLPDTATITQSAGTVLFNTVDETFAAYTKTGGNTATGANAVIFVTGTTSVSGGSQFDINSPSTYTTNALVHTGGNITVGAAGATLVIGAGGLSLDNTSNSTQLRLNGGTATLRLNGDVTVTGSANTAAILSSGGGGSIDLNGGTRVFTVSNGTNVVDFRTDAPITNGSLTKSGAGTFRVTGVSTYTGATTISVGELELGAAEVLSNSTDVSVASGAIFDLNGFSETIDGLSGAGSVTLGANTLTVGSNNEVSPNFNGVMSGTGGLTKIGTGNQTLSGGTANSYTGLTSVTAGTLTLNKTNNIISIQNDVSITGGSLVVLTTGQFHSSNTDITIAGGTFDLQGSGFRGSVGRIIFQSGTVTDGDGTINSQINVTANSNAAFSIRGGLAFPLNLAIDSGNANGITYDATGNLGSATLSGAVTLANATNKNIVVNDSTGTDMELIITGNVGDFPGANHNGLTKLGAGVLVLNGTNSYSGVTNVNAGTLLVNGSLADGAAAVDVVVASTATLGGTGSISGSVTVNSGGTINAGSPVSGTESLATGNLVVSSGGVFTPTINGTTVESQYDQVIVTGTVTLTGSTLTLAGTHVPNPAVAQSFIIIANNDTDAVVGTFAGLPEGSPITPAFNGQTLFISYAGGDGNDVVLYSQPTVNGTAGADTLVLRQFSGTQNEYSLNGAAFVQVTNTLPFTFNGLGDTDLMLVDTSNGDPIPTNNATFNGELLRIQKNTGAASDTATHVPSVTAGSGLVTLAGFGDVNYTGATNVDFVNLTTVNVQTATVNDTLTLADGNTATNGGTVPGTYSIAAAAALTASGANAVVGLRNVTNVNVDTVAGGTNGNDSVTINSGTGAHGLTNLAITTGTGTDTLTVTGALTVSGNVNISSQNIAVNATLTGGGTSTVTLNAGTGGITTSGTGIDVVAQDLSATATTGINLDTTVLNITATSSGTGNVNIDETNGANVLNVSAATGTATVTSATGNLNVSTVSASTSVTLTATAGSITDANGVASNVSAASLTASAATGIDLDTTIVTLTSASVTGVGAIDISDTTGGLAVTSATTADGAITLNATAGNLALGTVTAGGTGRNIVATTTTSGNVTVDNVTALGDNIQITAVGSLTESGADAGADMTAATATLAAGAGIGAAGAAIEVDFTTLTSATVSGTGILNLNDLAGGLVVTLATTSNGSIFLTGTSGSLTLTSVTAGGSGANVTANTTTSGNILIDSVNAAGDSITLTAVGSISETVSDGAVDLVAASATLSAGTGIGNGNALETSLDTLTATNSTSGTIQIAEVDAVTLASVVQSTDNNANDIVITAGGTITVGVVNAGAVSGDVTLIATVGAIVDNASDATADVIGDVVTLTAVSGVGEAAGNGSLDTTANSLDVSVTAAGLINLNETNAVTLTDIDTFNGPITIVAGGTITASDVASLLNADANDITLTTTAGDIAVGTILAGAAGDAFLTAAAAITDIDATNPDITADDIVLLAGTGVGTSVDPIETVATNLESSGGSGGVYVANTGALTIGGIGTTPGLSATGGTIVVTTTGTMTVVEDVTATGAGTSVSLTAIDAPTGVQNLVLNASTTISSALSSVTLNAGDNATITGNITSGTITTINVDFGDAESAGATATVGDGGTLTITGSITTPNTAAGGAFLNGGNDYDTFTFNPQTTTAFYVDGDLPLGGTVGDVLQMNVTATSNPNLTVPGNATVFNGNTYNGPGSGTWTFDPNHREVRFKSIEDPQVTGPYHLTYDNSVTPVGNLVIMLDATAPPNQNLQFRDGAVGGPILYELDLAPILSVRVLGGTGADVVTIDDINGLPSFGGSVPAITGVGNNTFIGDSDATLLPEFFFDAGGGINTLTLNLTSDGTLQQWALGTGTGAAGTNEGELQTTNASTGLNAYVRNVNEINRTSVGTNPGALTVFGDNLVNAISIADNTVETRISATGYPSFDFSGNNYTSLVVNGQADNDTIDLVSFGSGQTNNPPITLNGNDGSDTIRVRSTSGNTNTVTLNGNAGNDTFQLYDGTTTAGTVDNIAGLVVVDGSDGNVANNTDTLQIIDNSDTSADTVLVSAVNPTVNADYAVEGINGLTGNDVTFRNVDVLEYTGTQGNDQIDGQFLPTTPTQHDLSIVTLNGWTGNDQFLLFTSDQLGGTGVGFTPTGVASGVGMINLNGDAPGNPNAGDGNDIFGQTPAGIMGTGVMNVGLVVDSDTRMIRPSTTTGIAINGGQPTGIQPPAGDELFDRLNLDITALPNTNHVIVSTFLPGTVVAPGVTMGPINWAQIEDMNLVDQNKLTNVQMGDLFARTTPSQDLIQFSRNATPANPSQVRLRITSTIGNYSASNKTIVYAGGLNDTITQADLTIPAEFYGEDGNDNISGGVANDWLVGGLGNDRINGSRGDNVIWGDNSPTLPTDPQPQDLVIGGNDILSGLEGADVFYGGGGDDQVSAGGGNDYAYGGQGNDSLDGHDGDDRLYGGLGNDIISGFTGNDLLVGNANDDQLYGQEGNDVLFGGTGADLLDGGDGNDLLVSGSVGIESSSWTGLASTGTYSAATYTNPMDNDFALISLLAQWAAFSDPGTLGTSPSISHDGDNDDLFGSLGDDDFCWELADVVDNPPGVAPSDFDALNQGNDERFGPS